MRDRCWWWEPECGEEGELGEEVGDGFGVKEVGEAAAEVGGVFEKWRGCREWDAGPVTEGGSGVLKAVLWCVHDGSGVKERCRRLTRSPPRSRKRDALIPKPPDSGLLGG